MNIRYSENINMYRELFYNKLHDTQISKKGNWKDFIKTKNIRNEDHIKWFSEVLESYAEMQKELETIFTQTFNSPFYSYPTQSSKFNNVPDYIDLDNFITIIIDYYHQLIATNSSIKLIIIRNYHNVITGKDGIELDGGVCVEDGKYLQNDYIKKQSDKIIEQMNIKLDCILDPKLEKILLRQSKLKRILKNEHI